MSIAYNYLRYLITELRSDKQKLGWVIFWSIVGLFLLRGCIISSQKALPGEILDKIQKQYVNCINPEDTPIWPGEPRQPECGNVEIKVLGKGIVPDAQMAEGIAAVICYKAAYQNPYWSTQGTTRHEVKWSARIAYQVTVLYNGSWQIFPEEEQQDLLRWKMYSCPDHETE